MLAAVYVEQHSSKDQYLPPSLLAHSSQPVQQGGLRRLNNLALVWHRRGRHLGCAMTRKDNVARPAKTQDLDKATIHMLGIKPDAQVLSSEELKLVQQIKDTCDLTDFTPMNQKYGPMSGIFTNITKYTPNSPLGASTAV